MGRSKKFSGFSRPNYRHHLQSKLDFVRRRWSDGRKYLPKIVFVSEISRVRSLKRWESIPESSAVESKELLHSDSGSAIRKKSHEKFPSISTCVIPNAEIRFNRRASVMLFRGRLLVPSGTEPAPLDFGPIGKSGRPGAPIWQWWRLTIFAGYSPTKELEAAIFIGSRAPDNYYHWLINGVLKVFVANQGVKLSPEIPLLVPRAVEKWPQLREALSFVAKGRRIVFFTEQDVIHVKELFVHDPPPASDTPLSRNVTHRVPLRVHREALRAFRAEVLAKVITPVTTTGPRIRLFLLKPPNHPNASNQSELLEALSSFDFIAIEPEKMSFSQQVEIFSRAECVVGASGAGFTNILFAPAGCVSILWKAKSLLRENFFANLAEIAEGHVFCLEFNQRDRGFSRDVDPKLLVATLVRAGVAGSSGRAKH